MFWDKVSALYDLFENIYNGKVNRMLCKEVEDIIDESDIVLECACGTGKLNILVSIFDKLGANFKKQFDFNTYKDFFEKAGYKQVEYRLVEGRMPCAIAIITKQ